MARLLRIAAVEALPGWCLRLRLTDGSAIERDVRALLKGPIFELLTSDEAMFRAVSVEGGTVVWPNGADLCPDVLIWGGAPPADADVRPDSFRRSVKAAA